jgi:hypothetical protein
MIHITRHNSSGDLIKSLLLTLALVLLAAGLALTLAQKPRSSAHAPVSEQVLYSEYRGVRIGMSTQEVRAKLGDPLQKADDGDFYVFSKDETAQIAYDTAHQVTTVSVDYLGGSGAPDYKLVVGPEVEVKPDGSIYKAVRYESLGLWVFYNRSAGETPVVTITLQKSLQSH